MISIHYCMIISLSVMSGIVIPVAISLLDSCYQYVVCFNETTGTGYHSHYYAMTRRGEPFRPEPILRIVSGNRSHFISRSTQAWDMGLGFRV